MALSADALKGLILTNLSASGFVPGGEHGKAELLAEAIALAVVSHIQSNAQVIVPGGSSAGAYSVT